jgi:hypothetical protein
VNVKVVGGNTCVGLDRSDILLNEFCSPVFPDRVLFEYLANSVANDLVFHMDRQCDYFDIPMWTWLQ